MAALTLLEASKIHSGDVIRSAVIEMFARASDILAAIPFVDIPGNAYRYNREETLPGVAFRGINESYTPSTGVVNPETEPLVIAGGEIDIDRFVVKTMGLDQRSVQEGMKIKALALRLGKAFIKGDSSSDPREFDGLQVRLTGDQLLAAGNTSGGDALSLLKLDELIDKVLDPTGLTMNKTMRRLLSVASRTASVGGDLRWEKNDFGKQVAFYNDLPIRIADEDELGTQILPFTEANPGGGSAASTSIYCTSFGPGMLHGIQNGDMEVDDMGELQSSPVFRTRIEWYVGLVCLHGRAAGRLHGIKNATVAA
jgi:hypothetical protein